MKNKILSILLVAVFFSQSCKKDFLSVEDNSVIIRQNYVIDLKTLNDYLNGIYLLLSSDYFYGYNTIYGDLVADNVKPAVGSIAFNTHYLWNQRADESTETKPKDNPPNMNPLWTGGFKIIRNCNFVIEKADEFKNENENLYRNIKGQALALRAMVYWQLVNTFAQPYNFSTGAQHQGVPYIINSDWTQPVNRRDPVAVVYENMIEDLKTAASLLPSKSEKIYIGKNAALALLARTYFYKNDFQNAKRYARLASDLLPIMTAGYPENLYSDNDSEAFFQLPANYYSWPSDFFRDNVQFNATTDIRDLLQENLNDKRNSWISDSNGELKITKFPQGNAPGSGYNYTVIRSSEMYLTAAESYAKLNMVDSAHFYLDAIRKRSDINLLPSQLSGDELLEQINKERRKELCFEGLRMFDLLRTGKQVHRSDNSNPLAKDLTYPNAKSIAPIPALDVKLLGLVQNNGY